MSDGRSPRTTEHRGSDLGFAVRLVDAFTGSRPSDSVTVSLAEDDVRPVRNPGGYLVFMDIPAEAVTLVVDGGETYFDERRRVEFRESATGVDDGATVVIEDRTDPVVVALTPTPAYEFPDSATTIRGHVEDEAGEPIEGATVTLPAFDVTTWTSETGEYALFVPVSSETVAREDGRKWVRVDGTDTNGRAMANGGGRDPTIAVTHPDHAEVRERVAVEAGVKTVHYVTME